jgi:DNA-binding transcriptional MerR regulator
MRISELARSTGVSLATVKYYLREGLLPPGRSTAATQAEYDRRHADRLRLIRALVDIGGLSLSAVRSVLEVIDAGPDQPAIAVATAHEALGPPPDPRAGAPDRALAALRELGWRVDPRSAAVRQLDAALEALDRVGIPASAGQLDAYAAAAVTAATTDIASVPTDSAADAVAYVVLGTVLYEPVLLALRRLAQQHLFVTRRADVHQVSTDADPLPRAEPTPPGRP